MDMVMIQRFAQFEKSQNLLQHEKRTKEALKSSSLTKAKRGCARFWRNFNEEVLCWKNLFCAVLPEVDLDWIRVTNAPDSFTLTLNATVYYTLRETGF